LSIILFLLGDLALEDGAKLTVESSFSASPLKIGGCVNASNAILNLRLGLNVPSLVKTSTGDYSYRVFSSNTTCTKSPQFNIVNMKVFDTSKEARCYSASDVRMSHFAVFFRLDACSDISAAPATAVLSIASLLLAIIVHLLLSVSD